MKKLLSLAVMALSLGAFAAANDILISFSTPGPDTYKDGSTVLDGECYALVFSTNGAADVEIKANGSCTEGNEIVLVAPLAKGGKCPAVVFELPNDAKYAKGTFAVYLLDTRISKTDLAKVVNGFPKFVNGYAKATDPKAEEGQGGSLIASAGTKVTTLAAVESPRIRALKIEGATIKLTVAGMLEEGVEYHVVAGEAVNNVSTVIESTREDDTFSVSADKGSFFRIIGGRTIEK